MKTKEIINLYLENDIIGTNKLLEELIFEKVNTALINKKIELSEGEIKLANKKKKGKLLVRAGKTQSGLSAKHSGRLLFKTLPIPQLKAILATEDQLDEVKALPYKDVHKMMVKGGFYIKSTNGSHVKYEHPETKKTQVITKGEVSPGIVRQVQNILNPKLATESVENPMEVLKKFRHLYGPIKTQKSNRTKYKSLQKRIDRKKL